MRLAGVLERRFGALSLAWRQWCSHKCAARASHRRVVGVNAILQQIKILDCDNRRDALSLEHTEVTWLTCGNRNTIRLEVANA